jgi:hypothetical protein
VSRVSAVCFSFALIVFGAVAAKKWPALASSIGFVTGAIYGYVLMPAMQRDGAQAPRGEEPK